MGSQYKGHKIEVRPAPVKKGEVHYHHGMTWHGSGANTSGRPRRAIALHYMSEQTMYVEAGEHPMKRFITSKDGEGVDGVAFAVVWESGQKDPAD
jgi:ectoine hydroxylase-related dioxygenase (phytanoyl-CoA dioxygenase family)